MEINIIQKVIAFVLGYKYYANIVNRKGTADLELCCYIFTNKADAMKHKQDLNFNRSFNYVETVSFRSRTVYAPVIRILLNGIGYA